MHVGDGAAAPVLEVVAVVQPAADGLQGHEAHEDCAEGGVRGLEALF